MFDVGGTGAVARVHPGDVGEPLRHAPVERLGARAGLVIHLFAVRRAVAGQRIEREQLVFLLDVERQAPVAAIHELVDARLVLVLDALRDVLARVGDAEVGAQVAPGTRAVRAQVAGFARNGAALDRHGVDAVGGVGGIVGDAADAPAAVCGLPQQLGAALVGREVFHVALVQDVARIAVARARLEGNATGHVVGQAARGVARRGDRVVIAERQARFAGIVELRCCRDDAERAAHDVLAEQHALRAADDLDALEVVEVEVVVAGAADVHAVDEGADRRVGRRRVEARVGDAADVEFKVESRQGRHRERGDAVGQVRDREDLVFGQLLAGVRGDRDGRGLQGRFAALRRDDHFLEGLLRLRGHGGGGGENSGHRVGDG